MSIKVIQDAHVVRVSGEVDLSNVTELDQALDQAAEFAQNGLIIDLSDTVYLDSAGVHAILRVYARMRKSHARVAVVLGNERITTVLEVIHLELLPGMSVCYDIESAAEAISGGSVCKE